MGSTDADPRERVEPATFGEIVELAREVRRESSDTSWAEADSSRQKFLAGVSGLVMAIIHLPFKPVDGVLTLEKRLARAEAERLRGSCLAFERLADKLNLGKLGISLEPRNLEELKYATDQLLCALGQFIAMALDL